MSCQKGNCTRTRTQKHQNRYAFKNDLHDTNIRTKRMNLIQITNVCDKCRSILEWKIKYKKYKLLKSPRSCNKCSEKEVKQPYHVICVTCSRTFNICPKCEVPLAKIENQSDIIISCQEKSNSDNCNDFSPGYNDDNYYDIKKLENECINKLSSVKFNC